MLTSALLLYAGIGVGLSTVTLTATSFRRRIDRMARNVGMDAGYGRLVWAAGTTIAWPVGLYVLITGRLVGAGDARHALADDDVVAAEPDREAGSHRSIYRLSAAD